MRRIDQNQLNEMFPLHLKWLNGEEGGVLLNLSGCDASGLDFSNQNLQNADLRYANLLNANLRGGNLRRANLRGANLRRATLRGGNLENADLDNTYFSNTNLSQVVGIDYVTVGWSAHGAAGRTLNCIRIDGVPMFFCGCFRGTEQELRAFIEGDEDKYKASRTLAVDFCVARMKEMEEAK